MDDIFDSLIYIVIMIVAFVISYLGKKKKKQAPIPGIVKEQERKVEHEDSLVPNLESLLRNELGLENRDIYNDYDKYEVEQEEEVIIEAKEEILDTVPPEMLDDKPDIPYSIEYDDTDSISSTSIQGSDITTEESDSVVEIDDFDIRKAVIYSEIINRKEY